MRVRDLASDGLVGALGMGLAWAIGVAPGLGAVGAEVDVAKLPAPAGRTVDFDRDVLPILEAACFRCHGPEKPKSGFRLDTREGLMKGGDEGVAVEAGNSGGSRLIHLVARLVEDTEMPPVGKGEPLTPEQIGVLRAWIDQGATWGTWQGLGRPDRALTLSPMFRFIDVDGDRGRFREYTWMSDGAVWGVEQLRLEERIGTGGRLILDGAAQAGGEAFEANLRLEQAGLGFFRVGYRQYRSWYDDSGGDMVGLVGMPLSLGRDLHVDHGKATVELGLELPKWPRVVLGYDYESRRGTQSTLQWGAVNDPAFTVTRAIYPALKDVDERVHTVRLEVSHEVGGFRIEDRFRGEFYDLTTRRENVDSFTLGSMAPDAATEHAESYDHFNAMNSLRVEKLLRENWLVSGGYLYSRLDGGGGFSQTSVFPFDPTIPPFLGDQTTALVLDRRSHVFNVNSRWGPWRDWVLTAGFQNEWTRQDGMSLVTQAGGMPAAFGSDVDRGVFEEMVGLRYTGLPWTVVFAEGRLQQERYDHSETGFVDDTFADERDFLRDSDTTGLLQDYRAGFTISPWSKVSFQGTYRHRLKETDYDHLTDTDGGVVPGNGYPAFIREREMESDEFEARLVVRWAGWLKTTFKYQLNATDYRTRTDASSDFAGSVYPGGETLAGNYDAHVYSVNTTWTPWRRWYLTGTVSYGDTRLESSAGDGASVVPYRGDVITLIGSTQYVLSDSTDLLASYSVSRADYGQDNASTGLPLGADYDQHALMAGFSHRFHARLSGRLQYGFWRYHDRASRGLTDYTAHGVFAVLNWKME